MTFAPRTWIWLLLVTGVAAPVRAEEPIKIAVLDVRATGTVEAKRVEGLSTLIAGEAAAVPGLQVTSSEDIRTLLGFEAQKQLLSCTDQSCMAEIGGALGVEYLLSTEVTKVGERLILGMTLFDTEAARAIAREIRRPESESDLVDQAADAVAKVLAKIPRLVPLEVTTKVATAAETSSDDASPESGWSLGSWGLVAGGLAAGASGGVLYAGARSVQSDYEAGQSGAPTVFYDDAQAAEVRGAVGLGLITVGILAVAGAFVLPALDDDDSMQVLIDPRGGVAVRVAF